MGSSLQSVLITGASSLVGSRLAHRLCSEGVRVRGLVHAAARIYLLPSRGVEVVRGEWSDGELMQSMLEGVDTVFHVDRRLAGFDYRELLRTNEAGVAHVASACAECESPPVLVVLSSLAAAGPSKQTRPRIEADPPRPVSNHGLSRLAGERAARRFARRLPITIVRPGIVFGPGDRARLPLFRVIDRWGWHIVPSMFNPRFSLIAADDLVELMLLAAARGERVLPVNPGDPESRHGLYYASVDPTPSYGELGRMVARAVGRRTARVMAIPKSIVWAISSGFEVHGRVCGRAPVLGLDKIREATAGSWICSAEKAREQLGFRCARSLDERLAETAEWYRDHRWLPRKR